MNVASAFRSKKIITLGGMELIMILLAVPGAYGELPWWQNKLSLSIIFKIQDSGVLSHFVHVLIFE